MHPFLPKKEIVKDCKAKKVQIEMCKFNFEGKTFIEDTENSHICLARREGSTYISKPLVFGSVKDPEAYGEAPSRWAAGAIQLLYQESKQSWIFPIMVFLVYCGIPLFYSIIITFVMYAEWIILAVWVGGFLSCFFFVYLTGRTLDFSRYIIRLANTTYWFSGPLTAIFWMDFMPALILFNGAFPFDFNIQILMLGSVLIAIFQWIPVTLVKEWGNVEEAHLWRSQQAWYALWPLNLCGIPRLFSSNTSWTISKIQAIVTLLVNVAQVALLVVAMVYSLCQLSVRLGNTAGESEVAAVAAQITGLLTALYSIVLISPITTYLLNFLIFQTRRPMTMSSRHIILLFMLGWLVVLYAFNFATFTSDAFDAILRFEWPRWDTNRPWQESTLID